MHILKELWNGQINPMSDLDYRSKDYRDLILLYERSKDRLHTTLTHQQQEDLQKLLDVQEEMEQLTECAAFISGFRLAVQLMTASV